MSNLHYITLYDNVNKQKMTDRTMVIKILENKNYSTSFKNVQK
jgi:hypothetical protein